MLVAETIELIDREQPEVVCIGSLPPGGLASTRYLVKRLRARFPELRIVVWRLSSGRSFELWSDQLVGLGAERVVGTLRETRGDIMALLGSPRRPAAQAIGA